MMMTRPRLPKRTTVIGRSRSVRLVVPFPAPCFNAAMLSRAEETVGPVHD